MKRHLLKTTLALVFLSFIYCGIKIIDPKELSDKIPKDEHVWGNFGKIPYGTTISGKLFYPLNPDERQFCDPFKLPSFALTPMSPQEASPIFLVESGGDCSLAKKAYHVEILGGKAMILISKDETFMIDENYDDPLGKVEDIPTAIIRKKTGDTITDYMLKNLNTSVHMVIKFHNLNQFGIVHLNYFMKSDDHKSLKFFKEMETFMRGIKIKVIFQPFYKYSDPDFYSPEERKIYCVNDKYCGSTNYRLDINDPIVQLKENIRQRCIYNVESINNFFSKYWEYMKRFSENCGDELAPNFTETCSLEIIRDLGIDYVNVDKCMDLSFKSEKFEESSIVSDTSAFNLYRVHNLPSLYINGIKYKGSWYNKYIRSAICSAIPNSNEVQGCRDTRYNPTNDDVSRGLGFGSIFLIMFIITLITCIAIYVYRRYIMRKVDVSIDTKIQTQTIFSLGQYQVFQDSNIIKRDEDTTLDLK